MFSSASPTREDLPWLDFSEVHDVCFEDALRQVGLFRWMEQSGVILISRCVLHSDGNITINTSSNRFWCVGCEHAESGDVVSFANRFLNVPRRLSAEVWLLQFVPKQREALMQRSAWDHIESLTREARDRVQEVFEPERFNRRRGNENILEEIEKREIERIFGAVAEMLTLERGEKPDDRATLGEELCRRTKEYLTALIKADAPKI